MKRYRIEGIDGRIYEVEVSEDENVVRVKISGNGEDEYEIRIIEVDESAGRAVIEVNGKRVVAEYVEGGFIVNGVPGLVRKITEMPPLAKTGGAARAAKKTGYTPGLIVAPLDGKIVSLRVEKGSRVEPDTVIALIESMKMITEIRAGVKGVVEEVYVEPGKPVRKGEKLVRIKLEEEKEED